MATRAVEVLYRLKDFFTKPIKRLEAGYRRIRQSSDKTADAVTRDNARSVKSFDGFTNAVSALRGKFALLASGAVIAQVAVQANRLATEIDRLAKLGSRLDIDVNTLQALGYAAEQSSVSAEKMQDALENLQVVTGEALEGTGEAAEAFRRLGISVEDFAKLNAEEKVLLLADAFAAVESDERRAALAAKLFSEANREVLNVLEQGSGTISELIAKGRELRTLTPEMLEAAAEFKQTAADAGAAFEGATFKFGGPLLQAVNEVVQGFGASTNELKNLETQIRDAKLLFDFGEAIGADFISDKAQERLFTLYGRLESYNQQVEKSKQVEASRKLELQAVAHANAEYEKSVESLTGAYADQVKAAQATLKKETSELQAARSEQLSVEQEFARLRKEVTSVKNEDVTGLDVQTATLEARRQLAAGNAEGAIEAAREGGDLLKQLHSQGDEAGYVLGFLAKQLEEVAKQASQQNVDAELVDTEQAKAGLNQLTGEMKVFTDNAATLGADAGKAFVAAFQAQLNTKVAGPSVDAPTPSAPTAQQRPTRIIRNGSSFSDGTDFRREIEKRGSK